MATRVVAHRGASSVRPENTHAAVAEAIRLGASTVELDVQASTDGQLFVMHDFELDRTTSGEGLLVARDSEYVLTLDAGSWFDAQYANQTVPLLADVLDAYGGQVQFEIELRGFTGTFVHRVFEMIEDFHLTSDVTVTSYQLPLLLVARERQPDVRWALKAPLQRPWMNKVLWQALTLTDVQMLAPDLISCPVTLIDAYLVARAHELDVAIQATRCNDEATKSKALELGVDEISTDDVTLEAS